MAEHGVPKAQAYNTTMYIMAALLVIGFVCNWLVKAVHERHHMKEADLKEIDVKEIDARGAPAAARAKGRTTCQAKPMTAR